MKTIGTASFTTASPMSHFRPDTTLAGISHFYPKIMRQLFSFEKMLAILDCLFTLAFGIVIGQKINLGPGKFGIKNECRALDTHVLYSR